MGPELESKITSLNKNLSELKNLYEKTIAENEQLKEEIIRQSVQFKEKETDNNELIKKYESLKMAKTIAASSDDAHDAKIKVNKLVREIDKCISLLNQ